MKKRLKNTDKRSSKTRSDVPLIDGPGATSLRRLPGYEEDSTPVRPADREKSLRANASSTTSTQSSTHCWALGDGTVIHSDCCAEARGSKSCALAAMISKPKQKMSKEDLQKLMHPGVPIQYQGQCKCNPQVGHYCLERMEKSPPLTVGVKHDQGSDKPPLAYIPKAALYAEGLAFAHGAKKYDAWNYKNGLHVTRTVSAAMRHILQFLEGEDIDSESGAHHLGNARANLAMALDTLANHPELDDRFKKESK